MKLEIAIAREQKKLIQKYNKYGLYENFGQKEVRKLENKFINISSYTDEMNQNRNKIQAFNHWCMNFNG